MAEVTVYEPNSFVFDEHARIRRQLRTSKVDVDAERALSADELRSYDERTVLYDVALTHDNRRLVAVLPPPVNLENELFPITFEVEGDRRVVSRSSPVWRRGRHVDVLWISRPLLRPVRSPLTVSVGLADGSRRSFVVRPQRPVMATVTLTTLQKDNDVEWVLSWVRHYVRLGVDRVLLYDNGSANADEVLAALRGLPEDVDIVFVPWPFPHGPVRSFGNKFAQGGALNHANLVLSASRWLANFDIDEYLVPEGWDIHAPLRRCRPWHGLASFDSYFMPHIDAGAGARPSILNQTTRNRDVRLRGGRKYIGRTRVMRDLSPHTATVTPLRPRWVPPDEAAFLHYVGITTNWKAEHWDRATLTDPTDRRYVADTRVRDFHQR